MDELRDYENNRQRGSLYLSMGSIVEDDKFPHIPPAWMSFSHLLRATR
jgi:hypothetical protein